MHAKDAIRQSIERSDTIYEMYLKDLDDADLLVRPVPGMNHIAWQLGHVIATERQFVEAIQPGSSPALPEGFAERHSRDASKSDDPGHFYTKAEYLAAWKAQRDATKVVLEGMTDEQLDAPAPEFIRARWPTVGSILNLSGLHPLLHAGQFVAVRRAKEKPIAF